MGDRRRLPAFGGARMMEPATDVRAFIETHRRAFLVTRTALGNPTAQPMSLIPYQGTIYFNTYRKSAKVRNIERDPRAACLVTSSDNEPGFSSLTVQGRVEIVDTADLPDALIGGGGEGGVMRDEDLQRARGPRCVGQASLPAGEH